VDASLTQFCEAVRARLVCSDDFPAKRQFLLDYVEKIMFGDDTVTLHGSVLIKVQSPSEHRRETLVLKQLSSRFA
jgi:hypothetical protein